MKSKEIEETVEATVPTKNFLEPRVVRVKPIVRPGKWSTLMDGEDRKESFMYVKAKRTYGVPANITRGGTLPQVLDNTTKYLTPQFPNEPLTEQEFFERMLDTDLSVHLAKDNFWKSNLLSKVTIEKEGETLNLSVPTDYIKWAVLKTNKDLIAQSWEGRFGKATYEFALVDEHIEINNKAEERDLKDKAYAAYLKMKNKPELLVDFLRLTGASVKGREYKMGFLNSEVADFMDRDPKEFLNIIEDPYYEIKVLLNSAVDCGAVTREGKNEYYLPSGAKIGDTLNEAIKYLNDPKNVENKERIKRRVENHLKGDKE